ncbi:Outer envelope pore protein 37 chloroplastic [Bienertia sinuspersici]
MLLLKYANKRSEIYRPEFSLLSRKFSVHYYMKEQYALVKVSHHLGFRLRLQLQTAYDAKAQLGEVTLAANLSDPGYKFELASSVPTIGLPKATFKFPCGEVSLEEKEDEEVKRVLSVNGIVKGPIRNGVCTALYKDESLNLRYSYKDDEMSFIPSISLPSNAVSFAFKRRFSPSDKLSYWYNFDSNYWSTVYKHTTGKDYKFKAGYDSEVRLGWASLWVTVSCLQLIDQEAGDTELSCLRPHIVLGAGRGCGKGQVAQARVGDEGGKAKTAPMKMKVQFMLQVPQDDIKSSVLMFRVKKRWDI